MIMATFKDLEKKLRDAVANQLPEDQLVVMTEAMKIAKPRRGLIKRSAVPDAGMIKSALVDSLKIAAALEFSTIPPYLAALWSIKDQSHPIAGSIRSIIHEEMTHLALTSNLLTGLGSRPEFTGDAVPRFPQSLPGGVHPELTVELGQLNDKTLAVFLEIERPDEAVPIEGEDEPDVPDGDKTIGAFYEAVRLAIHVLDPKFEVGSQITGPLLPMVIADLEHADQAIELILSQGEGATGTPFETGPDDLAHYYRFKEVSLERRLKWNCATEKLMLGGDLPRPDTHSVNEPPVSGYDGSYPQIIQMLSGSFNKTYSKMLEALEDAWGDGGHSSLLRSMELMFELRPIAQKMIGYKDETGKGFIPEFRYVEN